MSLLDNENELLEQADNSVKDWHQRELDKARENMSWTFKMFDFSDVSEHEVYDGTIIDYDDKYCMYCGDYKMIEF